MQLLHGPGNENERASSRTLPARQLDVVQATLELQYNKLVEIENASDLSIPRKKINHQLSYKGLAFDIVCWLFTSTTFCQRRFKYAREQRSEVESNLVTICDNTSSGTLKKKSTGIILALFAPRCLF